MYYLMPAFSFRLQIPIDKFRTNATCNNFFLKIDFKSWISPAKQVQRGMEIFKYSF